MELKIYNSFSSVNGIISPDADQLITALLTYKNDIEGEVGQLFYQHKMAKKYGNHEKCQAIIAKINHLQANEYVCLYKGGQFPTGLLNIVIEGLKELRCEFQLTDYRNRPKENAILCWNNTPFESRYYQKNMIDLGIEHGRGVYESAVGTGKSLVMGKLVKANSVNSLIIVPSKGLSGQINTDFSSWFGQQNVQLLDAKKIRSLKSVKPVNIVTVQSLASLQKSGDFAYFARNIDALHVDELHHAGSSTYTNLLKDLEHVYYRYGYTGTFLRNDNKTLDMWGFLSNVLYRYPAYQAIQEGFLTPMEVFVHRLPGKANRDYNKEYDNNYCGNPNMLQRIYDICTQTNADSQILILVNRKDKSGKLIHEYLTALGVSSSYVSGDNSSVEINNTIKLFNDKVVKVLIGSSVIGEGIDVRSTDHLIMCQGGKSEIVMVQAIGRAIRLYPGKMLAYIHDFQWDGTKYMVKHLDERLEIYDRNFKSPIHYV